MLSRNKHAKFAADRFGSKACALKSTRVACASMDEPSTPPRKKRRVDDNVLTPPPLQQPSPKPDVECTNRRLFALLIRALDLAYQYSSDSESDRDTLRLGQQ